MKPFKSVDSYIRSFPPRVQKELKAIRKAIRRSAPLAVEKIAWGMPTYSMEKGRMHFAAFRSHISVFPGANGVAKFKKLLSKYEISKGTIRFPHGTRIPLGLVAKIAKFKLKRG